MFTAPALSGRRRLSPGEVESRPLLPSFLYLPHSSELPPQALSLPWPDHPTDYAVGEVARSLGVSIVPRSTVDGDGPQVAAMSIGLERPLTLVWRERRQPPAAAAFLAFVRAAAAERRLPQ